MNDDSTFGVFILIDLICSISLIVLSALQFNFRYKKVLLAATLGKALLAFTALVSGVNSPMSHVYNTHARVSYDGVTTIGKI